jgi:hypothetical protein
MNSIRAIKPRGPLVPAGPQSRSFGSILPRFQPKAFQKGVGLHITIISYGILCWNGVRVRTGFRTAKESHGGLQISMDEKGVPRNMTEEQVGNMKQKQELVVSSQSKRINSLKAFLSIGKAVQATRPSNILRSKQVCLVAR